MTDLSSYKLDLHCTMILEEYRAQQETFRIMQKVVTDTLRESIERNNIYITALESRIKKEKSLAGKLELKGGKYGTLTDLTDIFGVRVITFYSDEVDKIAALAERIFDIDWQNSVDKRKMHELDSFGYNSLHFICRIPKSLYDDPAHPEVNEYRFELQMRTALQHVWATMDHDTGYKSGIEIPKEYLRNLNRLAGMLELADEQFSSIRMAINEYRHKVNALVRDGRFDEVALDGETFRSYLDLNPFGKLTNKIASINQAEIHQVTSIPYLRVMKQLGFQTLGDVENLRRNYSDDAYQLSLVQLTGTDLDIISSTIAIQNLLVVYVLKNGGGKLGLVSLFDTVSGESKYNESRADRILEQVRNLPFMNR